MGEGQPTVSGTHVERKPIVGSGSCAARVPDLVLVGRSQCLPSGEANTGLQQATTQPAAEVNACNDVTL